METLPTSGLPTSLLYLVIPLISGLIGWITNFIAIKMLFRPRKPFRLLLFKVQGLVPKRQMELAASIGETVEKTLVRHEDITNILQSDEVRSQIKEEINRQLDDFFTSLAATNPMVGMFLQGPMAAQIKTLLVEQLEKSTPALLDHVMSTIESRLSFRDVVRHRIEQLDLSQLEELVQRISAKELKMIELLGAVLGVLIGVAQVLLLV